MRKAPLHKLISKAFCDSGPPASLPRGRDLQRYDGTYRRAAVRLSATLRDFLTYFPKVKALVGIQSCRRTWRSIVSLMRCS